jgi:dihydropyrimidinase
MCSASQHCVGLAAGLIGVTDYVRITSTAAAQVFNLYPRKGRVAAGSDADVIVLDPSVTHTISAATHHSRMDTNVYEGGRPHEEHTVPLSACVVCLAMVLPAMSLLF